MLPCHHVALELSQPGVEDKIYQKYKEVADILKDRNTIIKCELCTLSVPLVWSCFKTTCNFIGCGRSQNKHCLQHFNDSEKKHPICINLASRQIWCYSCDDEYKLELEPNQKVRKTMERILELLVPPMPKKENDFEIGATKHTPGACGLSNLGNTCFMNAAVQALSHCPPFMQLMTRLRPVLELQTRKSMVHNWCNLLDALWSGTYTSVTPNNLFIDLASVNPMFRGFSQQDSHECLQSFFVTLNESLKEETFADDEAEDIDPEEKTETDTQTTNTNQSNTSTKSTPSTGIPINKRIKSNSSLSTSPGSVSPSKSSPSRRYLNRDTNGSNPKSANSMSSSSTASTSTSTSRSGSKQSLNNNNIELDNKKKETPKERKKIYKSIMSDIFEGTLLSRVQCCNCGHISDTREVFTELSISIPSSTATEKIAKRKQIFSEEKTQAPKKEGWFGSLVSYVGLSNKKVDLIDCLHGYCVTDDLKGNDKYKCDNCKTLSEAKKTFSIFKPPEVLIIHLKRFRHDTLFGSKISDTVVFPLDNLDIAPFCVQIDDEAKKQTNFSTDFPFSTQYELASIVNHRGGYGGGHYVSYCFNRAVNKWQEFDDRHVSDASAEEVARREAYLLFYVRKPTPKQREQHQAIDQLMHEKTQPNNLVWIPRVWLERWQCMTHPGPLAARSIRCKHGLLSRDVATSGLSPRLVAVPRAALKQIAALYHPRVLSQQWREYRAKICARPGPATNGTGHNGNKTQSSAVNINGTGSAKKKDKDSKANGSSPKKSPSKLSKSPGKSSSHLIKKEKDTDQHIHVNGTDSNSNNHVNEDSPSLALESIDWSYLEIKIDSPICNICQVSTTECKAGAVLIEQQDAQSLLKRRDAEKAQITALDRQEISEYEAWHLINVHWLNEWRAFVLTRTRQEPPGAIDNSILLTAEGTPKPGLKRGVDYRGVTKEVWDYFISIYSGGPTITRKRIDIYEPPYQPKL